MKWANKKFNSSKNEYEITFDAATSVVPLSEEESLTTPEIPYVSWHEVDIKLLTDTPKDEVVDVIGVLSSIDGPKTVQTKRGELKKTDVTLCDSSGCSVNLCVWVEKAGVLDKAKVGDILGVKAVRVSNYSGMPPPAQSKIKVTFHEYIHRCIIVDVFSIRVVY